MVPEHDRRRYDNTHAYFEDLHNLKNEILQSQLSVDDDLDMSIFKKLKDEETYDTIYAVYSNFATKLQFIKTNQIKSNLLIIDALYNIISSYERLHKLRDDITEVKQILEKKIDNIDEKINTKVDKGVKYSWKDIEFYKQHAIFFLLVVIILSSFYEMSSGFRGLVDRLFDVYKVEKSYSNNIQPKQQHPTIKQQPTTTIEE